MDCVLLALSCSDGAVRLVSFILFLEAEEKKNQKYFNDLSHFTRCLMPPHQEELVEVAQASG